MTRHPLGRSALAAVVLAWPVLAATAVQAADVPAARNQANVASPTVASAAVPADWPEKLPTWQRYYHPRKNQES